MLAHTRTNKMEKRAMPDRGGLGGWTELSVVSRQIREAPTALKQPRPTSSHN